MLSCNSLVSRRRLQQERNSPMESFMQPFQASLWMALLGSVIFVGCSMYFLDRNSPFDRFYRAPKVTMEDGTIVADRLWEDIEDDSLNFSSAMWFVWGVLLDSGVSESTYYFSILIISFIQRCKEAFLGNRK